MAAVVWVLFLVYTAITFSDVGLAAPAPTWCVVRSEASNLALKTALDYACMAGADCGPIQSIGLCYLPNTYQAHASYAFNSYYQRRGDNTLASCSFNGTATIAKTDPSYGSCVYPSSLSNAGGMGGAGVGGGTSSGTNIPRTTEPLPPPGTTTPLYGGGGGGMAPVIPDSSRFNASPHVSIETVTFLIVFSFIFQTM